MSMSRGKKQYLSNTGTKKNGMIKHGINKMKTNRMQNNKIIDYKHKHSKEIGETINHSNGAKNSI